jgi:multidrug efflux pump subunit AcrA (membrane-fusion protein)
MISASKMAENLPGSAQNELILSNSFPCQLVKWKVSVDQKVSKGSILAVYKKISGEFANKSDIVVLPKLKCNVGGLVRRLLVGEGDHVKPGSVNIRFIN